MNTYATVVLAAGNGTRMRSTRPKVLHQVAGLPLIMHVLHAIETISSASAFTPLLSTTATHRPIVVLGYGAEQIEAALGEYCFYALQEEQLGTGHAVLAAQETVDALDPQPQTVLVCYGDTPLIGNEILARVLAEHMQQGATITFLTAITEQPSDFGRIVRNSEGQVREIVEFKRATEEQKRIQELNSGVYCFDRQWLWPALQNLPRNPSGEYYLTDLVSIASSQGRKIITVNGSLDETIGINDRVQLAEVEQLLHRRILERHMYNGVTIIDPATTYIGADVEIGIDTIIFPGTMITGKTHIGSECRIGPGTTIDQSTIGDRCIVRNSMLEETTFEEGVSIGPFSHCRPGAYLARNVRMGNFGEVKNSYIGSETDIHHFSYIGDATLGEHVNIGAGTITVNYDGVRKNHTNIGNGASIGSDTMLIAPVTVGTHALTGAGSVVNRDVPPGAVVVGVPAHVLRMRQPADSSAGSPADGTKAESGEKE
ncbi:MAG TPA: bifunctional UDP-N-acetylglucosamine diphosphorylase/glucosamine-1-phosphate N-acetyltransferase GlmU [Ktedonobacteraceae bacterium]|nr:bifunctional UDP-N-acetylglucosamine diphosphorylase/glucosamine-1-phosphate N-acetyltransferase GlmU [Ktedonobacteraceae bacterium]